VAVDPLAVSRPIGWLHPILLPSDEPAKLAAEDASGQG
jgi:hypothetical protein